MSHDYETFACHATTKSYVDHATFSYSENRVETINAKLKQLREEARMSQPEVARALSMAPTTYASKEDPKKFKGPLLPMAFAKKLATTYAARGIDPARVLALAGVAAGESPKPNDKPRMVALEVSLPSAARLQVAFERFLSTTGTVDQAQLPKLLAEYLPNVLAEAASPRGQRTLPSARGRQPPAREGKRND